MMLLALLAACGLDPEPDTLYGTWTELDGGVWRAFVFADALPDDPDLASFTDVYELWVYADGGEPVRVQAGTFEVADDTYVNLDGYARTLDNVLVTYVRATSDGTSVGATYGDPILHHTEDRLTLRSATADAGQRTFERATELP